MTKSVAAALYRLNLNDEFKWLHGCPEYMDALHKQALYFPSYAYPDAYNPIAVMGLIHGFGVGEVWLVTGKEFKGRAAYQALQLQNVMCATACKVFNLNRLEMKVDPKQKFSRRWPEVLGFEFDVHYKNGGIFGQDLELWVFNQKEKM